MMDAHDGDDGDAQADYDADPELRELLTEAAESPTVHRVNDGDDADDGAAWVERLRTGSRLRDVNADDGIHRDRVHEAADRALDKDADLIQRLREDGAGDAGTPTT